MKDQTSWWLVLLIAVLPWWVGCETTPAEREPGVLRVGVTTDSPPGIFREGGKVVGFEADFARMIGQATGQEIRFVEVAWPRQITALRDGRTDIIMSCMSVTQDRERQVAFTRSYLITGQMALLREADRWDHMSLHQIINTEAPVGVIRGTTGQQLVADSMRQAAPKVYGSPDAAAKALLAGKVDLVVLDGPMAWWLARRHAGLMVQPTELTEERYAWAVRLSDQELREQVNHLIEVWHRDGTITQTLRRWIPVSR